MHSVLALLEPWIKTLGLFYFETSQPIHSIDTALNMRCLSVPRTDSRNESTAAASYLDKPKDPRCLHIHPFPINPRLLTYLTTQYGGN